MNSPQDGYRNEWPRPSVKSVYQKPNFLISQPKHMLWTLKRSISMRRFFRAHKTYVKTDGLENIDNSALKNFVYLMQPNKGLTLNAPIATKVICFSRQLKCSRSLYGKRCGPRSDCSYRSSLFWIQAVCFFLALFGLIFFGA